MFPSHVSNSVPIALSRLKSKEQVTFLRQNSNCQNLHPAIPQMIVTKIQKSCGKKDTVIDGHTIQHLERISLVDFANVRGIERLEEAIELADIVTQVDTEGVQPLYSVLEDETLYLRPDEAQAPNNRQELMNLSTVTDEDYYVAPQGNVPLTVQKIYDRKD